MPQKVLQVVQWTCSRCGHSWQSRRGRDRPLRCAQCKSPYWDRPARGRKTRGIDRPPDLQKAALGEPNCDLDRACNILATWQADRAWISLVIEDNLGLLHCNGRLRQVGAGTVEISDVQDSVAQNKVVYIRLAFPHNTAFHYRRPPGDGIDLPYETLLTHHMGCTLYVGAFRQQPRTSPWLTL